MNTEAPAAIHAVGDFDGHQTTYTIKYSPRARWWRLDVRPGVGLVVVLPRGFDRRRLEPILHARRRWIRRTLEWAARQPVPLPPDELGDGRTVPFCGAPHTLAVTHEPRRATSVALRDSTLEVTVRTRSSLAVRRALRRWCWQQAHDIIPARVAALARQLGCSYRNVGIGDQRSRWGSCSQTGRLRFNWRLILMPSAILDYVAIHELTHLKVFNHSRQFWEQVAIACPSYQEHRQWLRKEAKHVSI